MILSLTSSILLWYSEKLDFWISRVETAKTGLSVIWVILAKNLIPRHALGELFGPSTRSDIVLYKIKLGWNYWIGTFYHLKFQNKIWLPCPITRIFSYRDGHPNSELGFGVYGSGGGTFALWCTQHRQYLSIGGLADIPEHPRRWFPLFLSCLCRLNQVAAFFC